ncbi:hypothetical protein [Desulfofalx alkaliphila]|uniref:hypothetical protein n=1 Tax=Desulfofalx alkaliphila TaxID=105483 RepID=UPI0004E11D16|nr:hypothetical protein [Desulfofalx alkaliphila]
MANVVEAMKEVGTSSSFGGLVRCCCLLLAGFIIGVALFFCGLLDWKLLGVWLFLMLAIVCCCMYWC